MKLKERLKNFLLEFKEDYYITTEDYEDACGYKVKAGTPLKLNRIRKHVCLFLERVYWREGNMAAMVTIEWMDKDILVGITRQDALNVKARLEREYYRKEIQKDKLKEIWVGILIALGVLTVISGVVITLVNYFELLP